MSQNIGALIVELSANIARFESDMGKAAAIAEKRMKDIDKLVGVTKNALGALGLGFSVGLTLDKVKEKIEGAISSAAGLQQLSERTGAAVEQLSGLASVAKLSGTDTEALAVGLQKLSKSAVDAQNGGQKTSESFKAIGISVQDLKGKSPDQMFDLVAKRLAAYQDGAEKTVVAQNLLGKSGANLLPMMKDLAEVGDLQVKVTREQAEAADELEKNQVRLTAASNAIYKIIGMELVPVFNAFTKALLDTTTANDGIKKGVDNLAKDGSIRSWAEGAVQAVGFVIDAFDGVARFMDILGKGLGAYAAAAVEVSHGEFSQAKTIIQSLGQDVEATLQKTLFSDRLKRQIEQSNIQLPGVPAPKKAINTSGLGNANTAQDPGEKFIEQLKRKIAAEQQDEFAALRVEAVQKKVSIEAEKYIKILEADFKQRQRTKQLVAEVNRDLEMEAQQRQKLASFTEAGNAVSKSIQDQTEMLGLNAKEQQRLTAMRQIDTAVQQAMQGATADTVVELLKMAEVMKANVSQALQDNIDKQKELNASWEYGANTALQSYLDDVEKVSDKVGAAVSNSFKGMEDALVQFTQTGKLSFSSLANSIIADLVRIAIQQSITGPFASFLGGLTGGATGVGAWRNATGDFSAFSAIAGGNGRASGGPVSAGSIYRVNENGPELLNIGTEQYLMMGNRSGSVTPNGATNSPTIVINNTIGSVASQADVVAGMQVVKAQIYGQLARQTRYGGAA